MKFLTAVHADAGIRKKKNQDSVLLMEARTKGGNILFASVCDGMGGLEKGETASAAMVNAFKNWFERGLPHLVRSIHTGTFCREWLWKQWSRLINDTSCRIEAFGKSNHIALGTTAVGILICREAFYTLNVGDSRVYLLTDKIDCLTKDQTFVQQEVDAGRMTYDQSLISPYRNMLLQCIGTGPAVRPVFGYGKAASGQIFLLCSDGFRHVVSEDEIYRAFCPLEMTCEQIMQQRLFEMTEIIKERQEKDNISAVLIRTL